MNLGTAAGDERVVVLTEASVRVGAEDELLARARAGDAEAFCALARPHEARLFRQAWAMSRRPDLAEELVVETMVEAWRSLGNFDGSCRWSTWLYAILLHRHQKATRRSRWRPLRGADLDDADAQRSGERLGRLEDPGPEPGDQLCRAEWAATLWEALNHLPVRHRDVLLLRFHDGASLAEIASALGIAVGTVKSRLHHGLARLRECPEIVNLLRDVREP